MSKYFPVPKCYTSRNVRGRFPHSLYTGLYEAVRAILKDPFSEEKTRKYSILIDNTCRDRVVLNISMNNSFGIPEGRTINIAFPDEYSTHEATLLIKMGSHNVEETWEEYKDLWYEDAMRQLASLERGNGP